MFKIYSKVIIPAIFAIFLLTSFCYAQQNEQQNIKIICGYKFPPFYTATSKKDPSKNLSGTFIDFLNQFQKKYPKYKITFKCMPRARINKLLIRGKADGFALTDPMFLPKEAKYRYLASSPMWTIADHLLVHKDSPIKKVDLNSMTGATIAVLHGNDYGPLNFYFKNGQIKEHPVYSTKQILDLLLKKRVDAAICNKANLPGLIKTTHHSIEQFRLLKKPLYSFKLHLLVRNDHSDFLNDFNQYMKKHPLPEIQ